MDPALLVMYQTTHLKMDLFSGKFGHLLTTSLIFSAFSKCI